MLKIMDVDINRCTFVRDGTMKGQRQRPGDGMEGNGGGSGRRGWAGGEKVNKHVSKGNL